MMEILIAVLQKPNVPRKFEGYNFLLLYSAGVFVFIG